MTTNNVNMFEVAVKSKFRFLYKGIINTEDLFDLSLNDLNVVYQTLKKQQKQTQEESLLEIKSQEDQELDVKIQIVKHIFDEKVNEREMKLKEKEFKQHEQKIMAIIARKQDAELENMSIDELNKMISK